MATDTDWIAVDWGTSNLRVWVLGPGGRLIDRAGSDRGMGSLARDEFEDALLELVRPHLPMDRKVPVICCGMVGARQGWAEAAYAAVPCAPPGADLALKIAARHPALDVRILPGICQSDPPDVMRGEEAQIGGYLATHPDFDGVLCLPGTHTKWAHVSAGEIVSFRTFMTGELFALLSRQSTLRFSVTGDGWDETAFARAVADAMSSPQNLTGWLFALRAGALVHSTGAAQSRARLSGLLIGMELAGARPYWLGRDIAIIGDPKLSDLYAAALSAQGASPHLADGDQMTLAGLKAAYTGLKETPK